MPSPQAKSEGSGPTVAQSSPPADCLLLSVHPGMPTLPFPSPQAELAWLPRLPLTRKQEAQQRPPPGVAAHPQPPAQRGSPRVHSGHLQPRQYTPQEDGRHLKGTRDQSGATLDRVLWSQTDDAAPLHLSVIAPANAAGSCPALERQGAMEGPGAEAPQDEHGMPVGTLVGHGTAYSPVALHQHVASKTLTSLPNTVLTQATAGLHTKTRQL